MPTLKEVARGSVQMLCVGRYSASKPQNLEGNVGVREETAAMATASPQPGQSVTSLVLASSHGLPAALSHPLAFPWTQGAPEPSPCHSAQPAEPPSLVLVLQEVFLAQVLVDPAGSEDGCGEAVLADQAQGLQRQVVSSTGWARQ